MTNTMTTPPSTWLGLQTASRNRRPDGSIPLADSYGCFGPDVTEALPAPDEDYETLPLQPTEAHQVFSSVALALEEPDLAFDDPLPTAAVPPVTMGSKAETLARLEGRLASARVLPQVAFTVAEWRSDPGAVIAKVQAVFPDVELAVRSSARAEDTCEQSNAGAFESRLGVINTAVALRVAIEAVIASYEGPNHG